MTVWKEDRLELALRASKEGIWDWNLERGTMVYSAWALRFLDYRRAEMPHLIEDRDRIMDAESAAAVAAALEEVVREESDLFAVEPRVQTRKGKWKWLRLRGTPVRDDEGKLLRLVGSVIDISMRKTAEQALEDERAFLRTLIDNIPLNVYFKDRDSRFVMANAPTAHKMGLSGWEDLVGKGDADFFSEEHAQIAAQHEREIMESGVAQVDVMEHETWEGKEDTWVISTKKPWLDREGKVKGTFGVTNDVSELMRAQQAQEKIAIQLQELNQVAEEERHLMRLLIDNIPLNVYYKDLDSRFVVVNEAMAKWIGVESPAKLQGKRDRDIFSKEHWEKAEADERRIIETGEPLVGALEKEVWSGKEDTWVLTSKYPWRNEEGDIFGTFGVSSDVSNLVRAQRELKEEALKLARKNEEMEEELSLAREVQQALIPETLPSFKTEKLGLTFKHLYRPASELGGDFFEVIPLGGDRVGFFVCDVMGHGVRSALIVSMLRGLIEKQAGVAGGVSEFLTGLNDGLCHLLEECGIEISATAVYGVVDLGDESVELGVAGHASPVAVFEDGVRQLRPPKNARGPALGMVEGAEYGAVKVELEGLKRMICFTDGLLEAEDSSGEEFGVDRFVEVVERGGRLPILLERLVAAGVTFSGEEKFDDDVCLLGWEVTR